MTEIKLSDYTPDELREINQSLLASTPSSPAIRTIGNYVVLETWTVTPPNVKDKIKEWRVDIP